MNTGGADYCNLIGRQCFPVKDVPASWRLLKPKRVASIRLNKHNVFIDSSRLKASSGDKTAPGVR
ncbi:MAG: hypothetical protein IKM62_03350 [Kiritimatiellae bacterium]|nr:hypothetical protein [Kiritimatiellia bacterium]